MGVIFLLIEYITELCIQRLESYKILLLDLYQFPFEYQSKDKIKFYIACAILITIRFKMSLVGGKRRIIAKQLNKVLSKQNREDVYLECKECAAIPIWDTNTKDGNQKTFDHYQ
jgi:hypothetical protein